MEIKVVQTRNAGDIPKNPALNQIRKKGYAQKYAGLSGITDHEVGLVFSSALRNLLIWKE